MEKSALDIFEETLNKERRELDQQCEGMDFKERHKKRYELYLKHQERIYNFENPNNECMARLDAVCLQYLLNSSMLNSNFQRFEIRTIVCDCLVMFDKLYPSLNEQQTNELKDFAFYLFWKASRNNKSLDHMKFYNPKQDPNFKIYPI
jgi:hypothetical protein